MKDYEAKLQSMVEKVVRDAERKIKVLRRPFPGTQVYFNPFLPPPPLNLQLQGSYD